MRKEALELGPCPYGEEPAQLGKSDYLCLAWMECDTYIGQLRRLMLWNAIGTPADCRLVMVGFDHEMGQYFEVVAEFPANNEAAFEWALWLEGNAPETWDDISRQELGLS